MANCTNAVEMLTWEESTKRSVGLDDNRRFAPVTHSYISASLDSEDQSIKIHIVWTTLVIHASLCFLYLTPLANVCDSSDL